MLQAVFGDSDDSSQGFGHMQIIEDESRTEGWKGMFIGFLFCELRRKSWSARTRKLERTLSTLEHLEAEAGLLDKVLFATAKSRIVGVLMAAGILHMKPEFQTPERQPRQRVNESDAVLEWFWRSNGRRVQHPLIMLRVLLHVSTWKCFFFARRQQ